MFDEAGWGGIAQCALADRLGWSWKDRIGMGVEQEAKG